MSNITREDIEDLNIVLTVNLEKNDYVPQVNKKLKEYRQKAEFKGFRPGKVPMALIRRRVGNSILAEEVNTVLNDNMKAYLDEEKLKYVGQPLPMDKPEDITLDINKPTDYAFRFELGLVPDFEVQGLEEALPFYDVKVDDAEIATEVERLRKQFGQGFEEDITDIVEDDLIVVKLEELEDGNVKEGGFVKDETFILVKDIAEDALREDVLTATIDDSFDTNVYKLERDKDANHVEKYVLGLEEGQTVGEMFRMTIVRIQRVKKAELSEEFYNQIFPNGEVADMDAFNERISGEISKARTQSSRQFFYGVLYDALIASNQFELPKNFLEKWIKESQGVDVAEKQATYDHFVKMIRWSLIREKLADKYEVDVTYEDVRESTRAEVLRYFNYQIEPRGEMVENLIDRVLKDRSELQRRFENLMDNAVLARTAEDAAKDMKEVSKEEFEAITKEREDRIKAEQATEEAALTEENKTEEVEEAVETEE
ncbi:MAG: hypothetical protein GY810_28065 [Aureispira sp.]|nr:hypothetical protein [Aureispira sp.]